MDAKTTPQGVVIARDFTDGPGPSGPGPEMHAGGEVDRSFSRAIDDQPGSPDRANQHRGQRLSIMDACRLRDPERVADDIHQLGPGDAVDFVVIRTRIDDVYKTLAIAAFAPELEEWS